MSHGKRNSKRKDRTKAVTVLGVARALSLAGGVSVAAVGPPGDTLTGNTAVTLYEEEIFDISLSTFYAFDHESAGGRRPGLQLTQMTPADVLIVTRLDRLARSTRDLLNTLHDIATKGAGFRPLADNGPWATHADRSGRLD